MRGEHGPCKHCNRTIHDGHPDRGFVHRGDWGGASKSRCDPDESGMPYGYNAEPVGEPCRSPCIGARRDQWRDRPGGARDLAAALLDAADYAERENQ